MKNYSDVKLFIICRGNRFYCQWSLDGNNRTTLFIEKNFIKAAIRLFAVQFSLNRDWQISSAPIFIDYVARMSGDLKIHYNRGRYVGKEFCKWYKEKWYVKIVIDRHTFQVQLITKKASDKDELIEHFTSIENALSFMVGIVTYRRKFFEGTFFGYGDLRKIKQSYQTLFWSTHRSFEIREVDPVKKVSLPLH